MLTVTKSKYSVETIGTLMDLPLVDPTRFGKRWKPIRHADLAAAMFTEAEKQYGRLASTQLLLSPDKETLIGTFELVDAAMSEDYVPGAFFRHDNKQGQALQLGAGGKVWICENGLISCEWLISMKHERCVDLGRWVRDAVSGVGSRLVMQHEKIIHMQTRGVPNPYEDFVALSTRDGLPKSLVFGAVEQWENPSHDDFAGSTQWSWYNAVTEAAKRLSPVTQTLALRKAFERAQYN